ncbi:tetratricopeptide repeat protein [Candidatus Odyssella acanthamoebae]|uniref:tetratricopeptide repeat protein n=1 Tax=Candidatus Odyssella acanthamoebae TaxID=91604 RepID=UPI00068F6D65|nr:tetratricopeptide repeat protein [Candidatus Paracaedibacter acanthamoebae]
MQEHFNDYSTHKANTPFLTLIVALWFIANLLPAYASEEPQRLQAEALSIEEFKNKENPEKQQDDTIGIMPPKCTSMDIKELAGLANNNDTGAQEEIVRQCLERGVTSFIKGLIEPFNWEGIKAKAQQDDGYLFVLLGLGDKTKDAGLFGELVSSAKARAKAGRALAQSNLGFMYHDGLGIERDYNKAVEWYTKAANQELAIAQNNLGFMYQHGLGVERDYNKAVELYTKVANQGYAVAQINLGHMYQYGLGVERDYTQAIEWYIKAVNQGEAIAQNRLGYMYQEGLGVERDYNKAIEWYIKAVNQGEAIAQNCLGYMYQEGLGVERDYNKAVELYTKSANQEEAVGQINLGYIYQYGLGVERDYNKAVELYTKAANQEEAAGQSNLGYMYQYGLGVERDYNKAVELYTKVANQGLAVAQNNLGYMYQEGLGVECDYNKAMDWYIKAANQGLAIAKHRLRILGKLEWDIKAASRGYVDAQTSLAIMYQYGKDVEKDIAQASFWFMKAKRKDHLLTIFKINSLPPMTAPNYQEEINSLERDLLSSWQAMLISLQSNLSDTYSPLYCAAYDHLEKIMVQFIGWRHQLNTHSGLMVSCLAFIDPKNKTAIGEREKATKVIPYVKQHMLLANAYLSFGEDNVRLADEIINNLRSKHSYKKVESILEQLQEAYKEVLTKAETEIKKHLQRINIEAIEEPQFSNRLARQNELAVIYAGKLQAVEAETEKFRVYYNLFIEGIKKGKYYRNQKFQKENEFLFN